MPADSNQYVKVDAAKTNVEIWFSDDFKHGFHGRLQTGNDWEAFWVYSERIMNPLQQYSFSKASERRSKGRNASKKKTDANNYKIARINFGSFAFLNLWRNVLNFTPLWCSFKFL